MGWIADLLKEIPSAARYKAELEEMEKENGALKSENTILKSENINLRQEIQRRDNIIQKEKSHGNLLSEAENNILMLLSKHEDLIDEQIARSLNLNLQIVKFHLQELDDKNMIGGSFNINSPAQWYLDHEGRKYLIENKLIS